jgi:hypothetical protein
MFTLKIMHTIPSLQAELDFGGARETGLQEASTAQEARLDLSI